MFGLKIQPLTLDKIPMFSERLPLACVMRDKRVKSFKRVKLFLF